MLFSSNVFLFFFLPVALLGFHLFGHAGRRAVFTWLSLVSLFFYGYWNPRYLFLLCASILLNFGFSHAIARVESERGKTAWLSAAITANLALLFWFKYLFPLLGFVHHVGWLGRSVGNLVLPLGISFFTFTQIAYLIDLRQKGTGAHTLLSYVLFVTFFPHLIAGPIIHHSDMMPQFAERQSGGLRAPDMALGLTWFLLGLAKKVLVADRLGPVADALYANPHRFGLEASWFGVLAYAVQLYFDFSGYSDMALGLARMFSIQFPINFNSPYKSANIVEFWARWHMTLSRYLTEYLYTPISFAVHARRSRLGKSSRRKDLATLNGFAELVALPTMVTMFLAGVWHGAGLRYIFYGVLHGVYITAYHGWRHFVPRESRLHKLLPRPLAVLLTFLCVVASFAFFRAVSARSAVYVLGSLLGLHHGSADAAPNLAAFAGFVPPNAAFAASRILAWPQLALALAAVWMLPNTQEILSQVSDSDRLPSVFSPRWLRWQPNVSWCLALLLITSLTITMLYSSTSFLYFQF